MTTISSVGVGSASQSTVGILTTGVWNATVITGTYGGTGVNNGASTITIGGNVTFSGGFTFSGTITGNTSVTFPTSGTLATTSQAALTWTDQTTTPVSMVARNAYSANNVGLVTLNVPATAAVGDEFQVQGQGAGGWLIRMNTGQVCNFGSSPTTSAGSLASTNRYDAVKIVCVVADTTFNVEFAVGNLTVA